MYFRMKIFGIKSKISIWKFNFKQVIKISGVGSHSIHIEFTGKPLKKISKSKYRDTIENWKTCQLKAEIRGEIRKFRQRKDEIFRFPRRKCYSKSDFPEKRHRGRWWLSFIPVIIFQTVAINFKNLFFSLNKILK